ncbi:MAG: tetratricopeptide repeat protein [Myxococcota bacterium]
MTQRPSTHGFPGSCPVPARPLPLRATCAAAREGRAPLALVARIVPLVLLLCAAVTGCERTMPLDKIKALQTGGRYAETIEPLRAHLEQTPDDAEIHLLYGTALARTGAARVAIWSLRKAAETPAFAIPANLELALTQARSSNWGEAIEAADKVIAVDPANAAAHLLRGDALLSQGKQTERALEEFELVLDEDPTHFSALTSRTAALLVLGRIDEAAETIDELESLATQNRANVDTQAQLCAVQAVLRQERGQIEEAETQFEDCLERYPAHAVVIDPAITFFDALGRRERSDALLEKALELAPYSISYRRTLALRKEAEGDPERALAIFREGLETDDDELKIAVLTDLANYHVDREELDQAIEAYQQAIDLVDEPTEVAILTHADLLAQAGRHEEARRVATKLENKTFVNLIEARIALDEDDPQRALSLLEQVFPSWPNNAGARYYAARAAERMGDFKRAVEEYRQSVRSAADQTEAALRLAKLFLAAGSREDAWTNAWQYVTAHNDDPEGARVLVASASGDQKATLHGVLAQMWGTPLWPAAVAERARDLADRQDAAAALAWIDAIPGPKPDWTNPAFAEATRQRALLLDAAGRAGEADTLVDAALAAHPGNGALLEMRAALLEAREADPETLAQAYTAAIEHDGKAWRALDGLARVRARTGDLAGAIEAYDRSTKVHPESPIAAREAARLAVQDGAPAKAVEQRWFDLLKEHPWDSVAAEQLAALRRARGNTDDATLDYAERAVMFGGGDEAKAQLVALHEARGETERAKEVAAAFAEGKSIPPRRPQGALSPAAAATPAAPPKATSKATPSAEASSS